MSFLTSALVSSLLLTSANGLYIKERRSDVSLNRRADAWQSVGCYVDHSDRILPERLDNNESLTVESCQNDCQALGFTYAGVEYGVECYCSNSIKEGAALADGINNKCDFSCHGSETETCGGSWAINVYKFGPTPPNVLESYGDWTVQGCFADSVGARVLNQGPMPIDGALTPQKCMDKCSSLGLPYSGLEYEHECFCGDSSVNPATLTTSDQCTMACQGDSEHVCGGGNALTLYYTSNGASSGDHDDWHSQGCYTDAVGGRTLANQVWVDGAMTVDKCTTACLAGGFAYAGVEYAGECFCASTIGGTGQSVTDGCNMPCSGNSAEMCGGANRLNVFHYGGDIPSTPVVQVEVLSEYKNYWADGCYVDSVDARAMTFMPVEGALTPQKCIDACFNGGFSHAGVEYSQECYCSNATPTGLDAMETCNMTCAGDEDYYCGGPNRLLVYSYEGTFTTPTAPTVLESYNSFDAVGCFVDSVEARVMTSVPVEGSMTVEKCVDACVNGGFSYAGLEYAQECFCSNVAPTASADDQSTCNMACAGDSAHLCGGPNRLNVYQHVQQQLDPTPI